MISAKINAIKSAVSGKEMMKNISRVASFHRIQGSEGYRDAAKFCCSLLREYGLESDIHEYNADYEEKVLTMQSFDEWNCKAGYCDLFYPEKLQLADYGKNVLSLFQKSFPADYRENPIELVLIDSEPSEIDDSLDLEGKVVFLRDNFNKYYHRVLEEKGAVGIITDFAGEIEGIRTREDSMNILKYHTFWWSKAQEDVKPFGFVIDHETGDKLAEICRDTMDKFISNQTDFMYPKLKCFVDSEFKKGKLENVTAIIPGVIDEEILLTAHLCHPMPSANDNASGVTVAIEAMRSIDELIKAGTIKAPLRTIRILLIPEYTGTYAYLQSRRDDLGRIKAGLNLDMVGGNQSLGYGPLTLSGLPGSTPSFVMDLAEIVLGESVKEAEGFAGSERVPAINSFIGGFTTGSDNFILSDPTIGIPAPMLGQWPDKFYHTSGDTLEIISEKMLEKSAIVAAAYAYLLATLAKDDIIEIIGRSYSNMNKRLAELAVKISNKKATEYELKCGFEYILSYYTDSVRDVLRFFVKDIEIKAIVDGAINNMKQIAELYWSHQKAYFNDLSEEAIISVKPKDLRRPVRLYISPVNNLLDSIIQDNPSKNRLTKELINLRSQFDNSYFAELMIQYHIDGKNTVDEVRNRVLIDCRSDNEELVERYIHLLGELGLVTITENTGEK